MFSTPIATASESVTPPNRRWQFSLATAFLVVALGVTVLSHLATSRSLAQLRHESYGLEVGMLNRIYVRNLPNPSFDLWQWKLHLPRGGRFRINLATKDIGLSNIPSPDCSEVLALQGEAMVHVIKHRVRKANEYAVTIRISQPPGTLEMFQQFDSQMGHNGHFHRIAGHNLTESFSADDPVVLLRGNYYAGSLSALPPTNTPQENHGILVWIDEVPTFPGQR